MNVSRVRYIIVNDKGEIFCGLARNYHFKSLSELGDTAIKSYVSERKAKSSFISSWYGSKPEDFDNNKYQIVKVIESYRTTKFHKVNVWDKIAEFFKYWNGEDNSDERLELSPSELRELIKYRARNHINRQKLENMSKEIDSLLQNITEE